MPVNNPNFDYDDFLLPAFVSVYVLLLGHFEVDPTIKVLEDLSKRSSIAEYIPAGKSVVALLGAHPFGDAFLQLLFDVFRAPFELFRPLSEILALITLPLLPSLHR